MLAVCAVWLVTSLGHSPALLCATIFVAAFLLPSQIMRFWAFSGMIAVIVLLAWNLARADPEAAPTLLLERMEDMAIGAALVLIFTALLFPLVTWSLLRTAWRKER